MSYTKSALVLGGGGFIGAHLVNRLKQEGYWVRAVDLKTPPYAETQADDFLIGDLRDPTICADVIDCRFDEIYQLAADMGGAGYVFTGEHDAAIMQNSALINFNVLEDGAQSAAFNLGNGQGFSVKEIIAEAERVTQRQIKSIIDPRRNGDPTILVGDSTLIRAQLGWEPKLSDIKTILTSAWRWDEISSGAAAI